MAEILIQADGAEEARVKVAPETQVQRVAGIDQAVSAYETENADKWKEQVEWRASPAWKQESGVGERRNRGRCEASGNEMEVKSGMGHVPG